VSAVTAMNPKDDRNGLEGNHPHAVKPGNQFEGSRQDGLAPGETHNGPKLLAARCAKSKQDRLEASVGMWERAASGETIGCEDDAIGRVKLTWQHETSAQSCVLVF
jgi:hypothetical protein